MKGPRVFGSGCKSPWKAFRVPFIRLLFRWLPLGLLYLTAAGHSSQGSVETGQDTSARSMARIGPALEQEHIYDTGAYPSHLSERLWHSSTMWFPSERSFELEGRTNSALPAQETAASALVGTEQGLPSPSGSAGANNSENAVGDASSPHKGKEQREEGKAKKKTPATNGDEKTDKECSRGSLRAHCSTWTPVPDLEDTQYRPVYQHPIRRLPLPPIQGLKRVLAGLVASSMTGGSLPAIALAFWGALDLYMSLAARATLRGLDPAFTASMNKWLTIDAAIKAKEERNTQSAGQGSPLAGAPEKKQH